MRHETSRKDLRIQKTLSNIHHAFHKLVSEKSYGELTVSAICAEARIGRKTFYMHYASLDALMEDILDTVTKEYVQRIKHYRVPDNIFEITREFYNYSLEKGDFYEKLVCSRHYHAIGSRLLNELVRETWKESPWFQGLREDIKKMVLCFIYNTGAGLYRQWVEDGKKIPLDDMIALADILLARGIAGLGEMIKKSRC